MGWVLIPGSSNKSINALVESSRALLGFQLLPGLVRCSSQIKIISVRKRREADAEFFHVRTSEGVDPSQPGQVQVLDEHELQR